MTEDLPKHPSRAMGAGTNVGLFVQPRAFENDLDYLCSRTVQGFKVTKYHFFVPSNEYVLVSIKPILMTTSDDLLEYEPNKRQCYFDTERELHFFNVYNQRNCELECFTNFTRNDCGCVKFSMPSKNLHVKFIENKTKLLRKFVNFLFRRRRHTNLRTGQT